MFSRIFLRWGGVSRLARSAVHSSRVYTESRVQGHYTVYSSLVCVRTCFKHTKTGSSSKTPARLRVVTVLHQLRSHRHWLSLVALVYDSDPHCSDSPCTVCLEKSIGPERSYTLSLTSSTQMALSCTRYCPSVSCSAPLPHDLLGA